MLVPITFRADAGESSKKGKIRPSDLCAIFAFSLPKKTGILNLLNKCDAYNVSINGGMALFYLHSGYVVICGRLIYVEEATAVTVALPENGTVDGYFGIKINLDSYGNRECSFFTSTEQIVQNDLNENPLSGVYEYPIYSYTATESSFSFTSKVASIIFEKSDYKSEYSESATYTADTTGNIDKTKTINEKIAELDARLTTLGFSSGDSLISAGSHVTITSKNLKKIGNYVIGHIQCTLDSSAGHSGNLFFIQRSKFCPAEQISSVYGTFGNSGNSSNKAKTVIFETGGRVHFEDVNSSGVVSQTNMDIMFGYIGRTDL